MWTREEIPHSRRSSRPPTSYPRSSSGLPMKERWMTAVQRECPLPLTQWLGDVHRLGPTPDQKASPAAIVHLHPAKGRACACMFPRNPTHRSPPESKNNESSDTDEGKDDVGDENANQGNNGSDEEKTDSDSEESDQEDTTP